MKTSAFLIDIICLVFLCHFFFQGIYKLTDLGWFHIWLRSMPNLRGIAHILHYGIPVFQLLIAALFLLPSYRLLVLYIAFLTFFIYVLYLLYIFLFDVVFLQPYHTYWQDLSWLQVVCFNVLLAAVALFGIFLQERILYKNTKILRKNPASCTGVGMEVAENP